MNRHFSLSRRTIPLVLVLAALGCERDSLLLPKFDEEVGLYVVEESAENGLVHRLFLSDVEPVSGDTLHLKSVVANESDEPVTAIVFCDLLLETNLRFERLAICPFLEPRETVTLGVGLEYRIEIAVVVLSEPGIYRVRAQNLVDPELWLEFDLRVRVDT